MANAKGLRPIDGEHNIWWSKTVTKSNVTNSKMMKIPARLNDNFHSGLVVNMWSCDYDHKIVLLWDSDHAYYFKHLGWHTFIKNTKLAASDEILFKILGYVQHRLEICPPNQACGPHSS